MESITKNRQPEETLRAMAARAYGPGQVPAAGEDWVSELGHGWFNVAYLMRLRDGSRVVLKIAPPPGVEVLTYERGRASAPIRAAWSVTSGLSGRRVISTPPRRAPRPAARASAARCRTAPARRVRQREHNPVRLVFLSRRRTQGDGGPHH